MDIARRLAQQLRQQGVALPLARSRQTIHGRALEALLLLWEALALTGCVLWMDNFYQPRYVANPAVGYASLNSTVLSVWLTNQVPRTVPHDVDLGWMIGRRQRRMQLVLDFWLTTAVLRDHSLENELSSADVRVPLDVHCTEVHSVQWHPATLSDTCVSSQHGLVDFLAVCGDFCAQSRTRVAPLLVDINLHYRLLRLACGRPTLLCDFPATLRCLPPLFGIWHAYKYCVQ